MKGAGRGGIVMAFVVGLGGIGALAGCGKDSPTALSRELQEQTLADLFWVGTIEGSSQSALHGEIFGGDRVSGERYVQFFTERVESFAYGNCGSTTAVACVYSGSRTVYLTPNYVNYDMPLAYRIATLFHEARHTEIENRFWSHATCPTPFQDGSGTDIRSIVTGALLQGLAACDSSAVGAYGLEVVMMKNISDHCTHCSEKVRLDAEIFGEDHLKRIIDSDAKTSLTQDLGLSSG